jgi:glycosyltransferase involved in cell wall biosynthesis
MRVALVHDYLSEFGGAERVLRVLSDMYPEAPIYTAFVKDGSSAAGRFADRTIIPSFAQRIPGFVDRLYSPMRFLIPYIWDSFDLDNYEVVISSASSYVTKGVITRPETLHLCYCHTPPRFLYGLPTSRDMKRRWPVRLYAALINKNLREYDYLAAQRVDLFVANSKTTQARIKEFYGRESVVVYPPVEIGRQESVGRSRGKQDYFLTGGRLVRGKNHELVVRAARELDVPLVVFGDGRQRAELERLAGSAVTFAGEVSEEELRNLYGGAKAFVALAENEDFGITPVEAMAAGTPVLAFEGGGYRETVIDGVTGLFIQDLSVEAVKEGMRKIRNSKFETRNLKNRAEEFSKERFVEEMKELVKNNLLMKDSK